MIGRLTVGYEGCIDERHSRRPSRQPQLPPRGKLPYRPPRVESFLLLLESTIHGSRHNRLSGVLFSPKKNTKASHPIGSVTDVQLTSTTAIYGLLVPKGQSTR